MTSLAGRHALVTGANRGIGEAIVRALASCGASVTLLVRDKAAGDAVASSLAGRHGVVVADLTNGPAVHAACADAERQRGPIDILVNNAGFAESAPFLKTPPALFERMIAIHLSGAVHTTQAVLPGMIERKRGHVVNMASTAGLHGQPYVTAYVAAKHALVGLTRALALEVEKHGVSVNAVCPGYTDTDLVRGAIERITAKTGRSREEALASILSGAHQQRLVTVDEVASAVVTLCTTPPGAPTGQAVIVDGSSGI
jgi:NAD(P)-dependent dehydrogenase (short-subunit alcohol dehydrogenase family)